MAETEMSEDPEIQWGKKAGTGGKNKRIQFYESFIYENVEYLKYDNVYLFNDKETEPYVGKLLKMWETGDRKKKGKVLWFFQREEISNFIGKDDDVLDNEVFLASGEAAGLADINPLEAIAGKCNVICISKDDRNRQPTDEEIRNADFVFRRTFDVGCCKIQDEIEEKIAGTDVKFLLNKEGFGGTSKAELGMEEVRENAEQNGSIVPKEHEIAKPNGHCINMAENENSAMKALSDKPESSTQNKTLAEASLRRDKKEKTTVSEKKALLEPKIKSNDRKDKDGKALVERVESEGKKGKLAEDSDELGEKNRLSKKKKRASENVEKGKNVIQQPSFSPNDNVAGALSPTDSDFDQKEEVAASKASPSTIKGPLKKLKLDDKAKLSKGKSLNVSSQEYPIEVPRIEAQELAMTSKLNLKSEADKSKWFGVRPWEDELRDSHEQGKLVLLQNLDPSYTSTDVEKIIMQAFNETCKAQMVQRTAFSSPYSGQAFVIFTSRDVAQMVVKQLDEGCLLLSNGRPLIASPGTPCFPDKKQIFYGHFAIDKLKFHKYLTQKDQKDAISTSHCSQPNTIEYDMATEWLLLQQRSEERLKILYKAQQEEFLKLKALLKSRK